MGILGDPDAPKFYSWAHRPCCLTCFCNPAALRGTLPIVPFFTMDSCPWRSPRLPDPRSLEAFSEASGPKTYKGTHALRRLSVWKHIIITLPGFVGIPGFLTRISGWPYPDFCGHSGRPRCPKILLLGAPAMLFDLFLQSCCPLWYVVDRPIFYNGFLPLEEPLTGNSTLFESLLRSIWSQNLQRTPRSSEALCVKAHNYHVTRIWWHSRVPYPDFGLALPGFLWAFWATSVPQNSTFWVHRPCCLIFFAILLPFVAPNDNS